MAFQTFIITGIVQAGFLALLILIKKNKERSDFYFVAWLITVGLHLTYYLHNISYFRSDWSFLYLFGFPMALLHSPMLYLYTKSLTKNRNNNFIENALHLIPYFVYMVVLVIFFTQYGIEIRYGFLQFSTNFSPLTDFYGVPIAISGGIYPVLSFFALKKYHQQLPHYYSLTEKLNLNWLKYWIISSLLFFILVFVMVTGAMDFNWFNPNSTFKWVSAFLVIQIFYIGLFGLRQSALFSNLNLSAIHMPTALVNNRKTYSKSGLDKKELTQLALQLASLMENKKPYLNPSLTLDELADLCALSPNHLSQVINSVYGKNFYYFINSYRIEEVKKQLVLPGKQHMKLLSIAFDCGFSSKSTFNKIFKELLDKTPSEYLKSIKSKS